MNRNQAKEFFPIMQAFAEGKVIECRTKPSAVKGTYIPNDWTEMKEIEFWNNTEYRVKSEPKYRPFADAEECWKEMQKHQPFGWVKDKKDGHYSLITSVLIGEKEVDIDGICGLALYTSINYYTFADDTPFGVKEEE
ncbi:MAG: hypothetical protein ACOCPC_03240 [Segatella copri]